MIVERLCVELRITSPGVAAVSLLTLSEFVGFVAGAGLDAADEGYDPYPIAAVDVDRLAADGARAITSGRGHAFMIALLAEESLNPHPRWWSPPFVRVASLAKPSGSGRTGSDLCLSGGSRTTEARVKLIDYQLAADDGCVGAETVKRELLWLRDVATALAFVTR